MERRRTLHTTMLRLLLLLSVSAAFAANVSPSITYSGWRVLEILLEEDGVESDILQELNDIANPNYLEILRTRRDKGVAEVAVSPDALENLRRKQQRNDISFNTVISDLSKHLEMNGPSLRASALPAGEVTFDRFMDVEEIMAHIEELPRKYPDKVSLKKVGDSVENRPLYLVTVNTRTKKDGYKPVIFIDGGIHAREWITPAAALYIIGKLLESPSLNREIEWQIMPLLNPDGYAYTWTHDRLWRKNRANVSWQCYGTDLNRNFGFHWGEAGSSSYECSSIYRGSKPFSEPESQALRDAVTAVKDRVEAYVSLHSYGQYILHPWGYTTGRTRFNDGQLYAVGDGMAKVIMKNDGTAFQVGSAAKLLYPAAGGSDDWVAGEMKVPLSYTFELRDEGAGGFILPESQIRPAITDAWLAMRYLGRQLIKKGGEPEATNGTVVIDAKTRQEALTQQPAETERPPVLNPVPVRPRPTQAPIYKEPVRRPQQSRPIWGGSSEENSSSEESGSDEDSDEDRK